MEHRIAKEQMRGKWASSIVDFGYTETFCIPELTSEFISFVTVFLGTLCCSIKKIEAPYLSDSELWIATHEMQGNQASSPGEWCVMGFLELRQEHGVYSRVTAGMAIRTSTFFSEVRTPV